MNARTPQTPRNPPPVDELDDGGKARAPSNERKGWKWADGKIHDTPPPSSEPYKPPTIETPIATSTTPAPAIAARAPVPDDFTFTDRSRLRSSALDFAIRAGGLMGSRIANGAELLAEAEQIERWIAEK